MSSDQDPVGYQKPPRHTRFKKGVSGNPGGRPKRSRTLKEDLISELQSEVTIIVENGKEQRVSKQQAFFKMLTTSALKQDMRAVGTLLGFLKYFRVDLDDQEPEANEIDLDDLQALEDYLAQAKMRLAQGTEKPKKGNNK